MHRKICRKGASISGALFALRAPLYVLVLAAAGAANAGATDCPASHIEEHAQVVYVYDGDTFKLKDGRRVRLIGINTPELGRNGSAAGPLAGEARDTLLQLLDTGHRKVQLQYGAEQHDRYGRLLAHAFLETGENIAVRLLQQGLATTLVVPPNTWAQDCYQVHEDLARSTNRGLWALADYRAQDALKLTAETRGFRIVRGRVTEVRQSRHSVWVEIDGPLVVRIPVKDLVNFKAHNPEQLVGHSVEIRGWISQDRDGLRLTARHPAALIDISHAADEGLRTP